VLPKCAQSLRLGPQGAVTRHVEEISFFNTQLNKTGEKDTFDAVETGKELHFIFK
jgi:hypothetical protein